VGDPPLHHSDQRRELSVRIPTPGARRGRILAAAAALITTIVVLGTASAAPARPPASGGGGGATIMADETYFCTWIQSNALCTHPTARLNLRGQPNTSSGIVTTMDPDSIVWLHCWTTGQSVNGDNIWYWVDDASDGIDVNPIFWPEGWAAGYYLATGHDPNPRVPHC
jgi:hypothetical protein